MMELAKIAGFLALGYLGVTLLVFLMQDSLLFPGRLAASPTDRFDAHEISLTVSDGIDVRGWLVPVAGATATIVYYGGNGEEVSWSIDPLSRLGPYNILAVNYRGYGRSEGKPSEKVLKQDAIRILDKLAAENRIDPGRIHLVGRSLGSGVAVHVAARREVASLTLLTPYDSIQAVASGVYPILPVRWLIRHPFRSIDEVGEIRTPTLIIKAERDEVIPAKHSDRLIGAWQGPLTTRTLPGTTHNSLYTAEFFEEVGGFLANH